MIINEQDNLIFKNYIQEYFKKNLEKKPIEIIVRPECNQTCEYCYIYQHGQDLYPKEKRKDNKTLLNNFHLLLEYLKEKNLFENIWDIFAGDLFYDNFWFEIMDELYDYFSYMINNNIQKLNEESYILIPCNMRFCEDDNKLKKVKEYIQKFKNNLNTFILFSWSTDGKYSNNIREKNFLSDDYYKKVFDLIYETKSGLHTMISYEGIDNAIENYKWFKEEYLKYDNFNNNRFPIPYFLEVRNHGWTKESIFKFIQFLDFMVNDRFAFLDYDLEKFTKHLFFPEKILLEQNIILPAVNNDLIKIYYFPIMQNFMACSLQCNLVINLADLSFPACHRLTYSFFNGGHFKIENNKIIDLVADEGVNGYFNQKISNSQFGIDCYGCENKFFCKKGCHGAQFEYNAETYSPIPDVCLLLNNELNFLIKKYHDMGVFDYLFTQQEWVLENDFKFHLIQLLSMKGYPEYEYKYSD